MPAINTALDTEQKLLEPKRLPFPSVQSAELADEEWSLSAARLDGHGGMLENPLSVFGHGPLSAPGKGDLRPFNKRLRSQATWLISTNFHKDLLA